MSRIIAIVNPVAGRGRAGRAWPAFEEALRATGISPEVWYTQGPGDARDMGRRARELGCSLLLVTGGDGTIHETLNGTGPGGPPLVVVPLGTGNDLARGLHVQATPAAIAALVRSGRVRRLDLGRIDTAEGSRYFVNVSGAGFDAEVARRVLEAGGPGRGAVPYVLAMLRTLRAYQNVDLEVEVEGQRYGQRSLMVVVGNSPYYGGGMHILPGAQPDDGRFDLCLIGDLGKLETLRVFPRVFRGTHVHHPRVRCLRGREVYLTSRMPVAVHADGEPVGYLPARYRNFPGGMAVVVPSPAEARPAAAQGEASPAEGRAGRQPGL